MSFAIISY